MLIGLVVANIFKPGAGMNIDLRILHLPLWSETVSDHCYWIERRRRQQCLRWEELVR